MNRRHPDLPAVWLITDARLGSGLLRRIRSLPSGSGILVRHHELPPRERHALMRRIRAAARPRGLTVLDDGRDAIARVHSMRELTRALAANPKLLLLSPMFPTRSHPDWKPLSRMRAASLARLAGRPVLALGGMNKRRFERVRKLGFSGWGGIDAFG